jgi:hypothetical protein
VQSRVFGLQRLAGQNTGNVADLPERITNLVRDVERTREVLRIPAPLPRELLAYKRTTEAGGEPAIVDTAVAVFAADVEDAA